MFQVLEHALWLLVLYNIPLRHHRQNHVAVQATLTFLQQEVHFTGLKVNFGTFKQVVFVKSGIELKPKIVYHLIKETVFFYNV